MKVKCLDCGFKVDDTSEACPKCGTKLRWYQRNTPATFGFLVFAVFFALVCMYLIFFKPII